MIPFCYAVPNKYKITYPLGVKLSRNCSLDSKIIHFNGVLNLAVSGWVRSTFSWFSLVIPYSFLFYYLTFHLMGFLVYSIYTTSLVQKVQQYSRIDTLILRSESDYPLKNKIEDWKIKVWPIKTKEPKTSLFSLMKFQTLIFNIYQSSMYNLIPA